MDKKKDTPETCLLSIKINISALNYLSVSAQSELFCLVAKFGVHKYILAYKCLILATELFAGFLKMF